MAFYMRLIGGGAFGNVYKMNYNGKNAAVKRVPMHKISDQHLEREWAICQQVNHSNVVKILGRPWLAESKWHFPLEFICGETLETVIFEPGESDIRLSLSSQATIITGMCEGLHYLHKNSIVHQDLKPDNIMVEYGSLRAVIIDLGLAKFYRGGYSSATPGGNVEYAAPEIFSGHRQDMSTDVWAMGKIIGELLLLKRLPTRELSSAMIQTLLCEHPYCDPIANMVDGSRIQRASMASVIGALRSAGEACSRGSSRQTSLSLVRAEYSNQAMIPNVANALAAFGIALPMPIPSSGKLEHHQLESHGDNRYTFSEANINGKKFMVRRTTYSP
ncbi:hypothetical protein GJAV_G00004500 [Gymnothorax javanicus]|nr:hypothetical protein GJAV_G00004500 [Gymnothorax javanicus]